MDILSLTDVFFFGLNIALAAWAYSWWRKYKHRDYFWLAMLWTVLALMDVIEYLIDIFVTPSQLASNSLKQYVLTFSLEAAISWTVIFYIFVLMSKWFLYSPRSAPVYGWLQSKRGMIIMTVVIFVFEIVSLSLLAQMWLSN